MRRVQVFAVNRSVRSSMTASLSFVVLLAAVFAFSAVDAKALTIAAGGTHTCAINSSGGAQCWGEGQHGMLGNSADDRTVSPVAVTGLGSGVTAISASPNRSCAITSVGAVKCWGYGLEWQLGHGLQEDSNVPVQVSGLTIGATAISTGPHHSCAIVSGTAKCWGDGGRGQIGNGSNSDFNPAPVDVFALGNQVTSISAGWLHTCAIVAGAAKCWGDAGNGALGAGPLPPGDFGVQSTAVDVIGLGASSGVTSVSAGAMHSCAVAMGGAKCWGSGFEHQLGHGTAERTFEPVTPVGLGAGSAVTAISAGYNHTCAIVGGGAKCWGSGANGQLGTGRFADSETPVDVVGAHSGVTAISAGDKNTCLIVNGVMKCFGDGGLGQLGLGQFDDFSSPIAVTGLSSGASSISAAGSASLSCAVSGGAGKCWGKDAIGMLSMSASAGYMAPQTVTGLESGVTDVATYSAHACAVKSGGARCWGYNGNGQLGDGTTGSANASIAVPGLASNVAEVTVGANHSCARLTTGEASCWGHGFYGALGTGDNDDRTAPTTIFAGGVTAISAGAYFTCAVVSGGAKCWGDGNAGTLGNGSTDSSPGPVDVDGLTASSGVTAISAGNQHACAVVAGDVKCWGQGWLGQLGNSDTAASSSRCTSPNARASRRQGSHQPAKKNSAPGFPAPTSTRRPSTSRAVNGAIAAPSCPALLDEAGDADTATADPAVSSLVLVAEIADTATTRATSTVRPMMKLRRIRLHSTRACSGRD